VICHNGTVERDGAGHQAIYNMYTDASNFTVTIDNVTSVDNTAAGGGYNVTMTFTILQNGTPLADKAALLALKQKTFYTSRYDNTTMQFFDSKSFSSSTATATGTPGQFTVTSDNVAFAPESPVSGALVYMYVASDLLDTEAEGRGHYHLYNNVLNIGEAFGDNTYVSAANVSGCEKCHGKPYRKHGYRMAVVTGLPDFVACKTCHYDNRVGEDFGFQVLAEDPARFFDLNAQVAAGGGEWREYMTAAEVQQYGYTANVMNDTHMSHAMEFPYPQSMANCATCHEGKLDMILTDANFVGATCLSCHPVNGPVGGTAEGKAPALATIMPTIFHGGTPPDTTYIKNTTCNACHKDPVTGGIAPRFSAIHTGYDKAIYAAADQKYSDAITVSIDNATLVGTDLTIEISADGTAGGLNSDNVVPALLVGLYGYDTKDFIVNGHDRWDSNCNGTISRGDNDQPIGEYVVGDEDPLCPNPYFTLVSEAPGAWVITAHLSTWAGMIDNNVIKRVEIGVMPELDNGSGGLVPLNAVSRTFVLATGDFDDGFFGHNIVDVGKCNACHDQLATTFHSGDRGGSVTVCRMCHVTLSGGAHLEMQSRSIDSYVHAIHSFQAFDIGGINFDNTVESGFYDLHIEHTYPNFTIMNCESCHNAGTYNVPDQTRSLFGVLSASSSPLDGWNRNIGEVPSYITGPATRACGACHRTQVINEDNAGELAVLFGHWGSNGTLIEAGDPPNDIYTVIGEIFSIL
jgi:OmcA/MtrC family decaheme c-type cytochrome